MKILFNILSTLILAFIFVACSSTRRVEQGQYLLKKNKIIIENPHKAIESGDLYDQVQQKTNKKILGIIPFKLWYNSLFKNKGESPVIIDEIQIDNSKEKIAKFLNSSGFFNSQINHEISYQGKKKARVLYKIKLSEPYYIRDMEYVLTDSVIYQLFKKYRVLAEIEEGDIYNEYQMDKERDRLSVLLNNKGFYRFSKDFIFYKVDSSLNSHEMSVDVVVKDMKDIVGEESGIKEHKQYVVKNINVYPDFKFNRSDTIRNDTLLVFPMENLKAIRENPHRFIYGEPMKIKPKAISRGLLFKSGDQYSADAVSHTYSKLNQLGVFKKTNIKFEELEPQEGDTVGYLDCNIQLAKRPSHAYTAELNGTNKGGDLGVGGNLSYQNRNLFRGAELLSIRLKGGVEFQKGGLLEEEGLSDELKYYTIYETGVDAKLLFPVFLAPIRFTKYVELINPKTSILTGYNFQSRRDYRRTISNLSYGYSWRTSFRHEHQFYPIDINLVKVEKSDSFKDLLLTQPLRLQDLYKDHLIFSLRYSYVYNGQNIYKLKNFIYYRGTIEPSGNILNAIASSSNQVNEDGYNTVFNIRYAQFIKTIHDLRYYIFFQKDHSLAFRTNIGLGVPYGNSVDLPLGKAFYGGGANDMRGWRLRYLGPGSYQNPEQNIESFGDIILEGNFEYRFPLYSYFKGALFYDVGNIWMIKENETYPGGEFKVNRFYKELAMDAGIGLRLDFSYFLIRLDVAQKLKDPSLPIGERWIFSQKKWVDPILNFGIGYPF